MSLCYVARILKWGPFMSSVRAKNYIEGGAADAVALPSPRPAHWLEGRGEQFVWAIMAIATAILLGLWLRKHALEFFSPGMLAAGKVLLSSLAISAAGFAQGLTGFGYGLVAIALLPMLMNLKEAVALAALLNLVVCVRTFLSMRAHYSWRQGLGLVIGACLGVPVGTFAMVRLDEVVLLRILGGLMLLFSANELILGRRKLLRLSPALGFPFGLASGGLSGAFGVGGPPAIAYTYSQAWSKEQVIAVLQVVFGLSALLRLVLLGRAGFVSTPMISTGLLSVLPLLGAIALGQRYFTRIPQPALKRAAFLFLWVMGLKYLLFA